MIRNFHGDHNFMALFLRDRDLRMSENSGRRNGANGETRRVKFQLFKKM